MFALFPLFFRNTDSQNVTDGVFGVPIRFETAVGTASVLHHQDRLHFVFVEVHLNVFCLCFQFLDLGNNSQASLLNDADCLPDLLLNHDLQGLHLIVVLFFDALDYIRILPHFLSLQLLH